MNSRDIHEMRFKTRLSGYSTMEVDNFMAQIADALDSLSSEKDQLQAKNEALSSQLEEYKEMERAIRESMVSAQKTSISITDEARVRAGAITESAQEQAKKTIDEANASSEKIIGDAHSKTAQLHEMQKRLSAVIEDYKKQIRTVMSTQLAAMEDIFVPVDADSPEDLTGDNQGEEDMKAESTEQSA
ncbi:MAG: DivIVA domain-containing protein [Christensenellales bacterium]|jgi:cell division initiation protein